MEEVVVLTFGGSFAVYKILIKRFNITRILFSMKTIKKNSVMNVEESKQPVQYETNN